MSVCKIGVRDGEATVKLTIDKVDFEIGITEFRWLLGCAALNLKDLAAPSVANSLREPVALILSLMDNVIATGPASTPEQLTSNLERYHRTGTGGVKDLSPLIAELDRRREATYKRNQEYLADLVRPPKPEPPKNVVLREDQDPRTHARRV